MWQVLAVAIVFSRYNLAESKAQCTDDQITKGLQQLTAGNDVFTGDFYAEENTNNGGASDIMSPFSFLVPLAQLGVFTNGDSYKEVIKVLNIEDSDEIKCVFKELITRFNTQSTVELDLAAKIYADQKYPLTDNFVATSKEYFGADATNVDFARGSETADTINDWVANKTHDKIKDIVSADMFDSATRAVLANAIYFKGAWQYKFDKKDTKKRDFYSVDGSSKQIDFMYQKTRLRYAKSDELSAQILELPYSGRNVTCVIILPDQTDGIKNLREKMRNPSALNNAISSMSAETVQVYLPPIKVSTTIDLISLLSKIGITKLFTAGQSGLTDILKSGEDIYISKAIQKAFIEMNEDGTEAAAANVLIVGRAASISPTEPRTYVFEANRPYILQIRYKDVVLFVGSFYG